MRCVNIEDIFVEKRILSEVLELKQMGLMQMYTIAERASWLKIGALILIGIVQFGLGACLLGSPVSAPWGMSLMAEGISDIFYAVAGGVTGKFSWKEYAIQKAIGLTFTVVTAGLLHGINLKSLVSIETKLSFKESLLTSFKLGPGPILKRAFEALAGKSFVIGVEKVTGEKILAQPQLWKTIGGFLLRKLYSEKANKLKTDAKVNHLMGTYLSRLDEEDKNMKSKLNEILKNSKNFTPDLIDTTQMNELEERLSNTLSNESKEVFKTSKCINNLIESLAISHSEKILSASEIINNNFFCYDYSKFMQNVSAENSFEYLIENVDKVSVDMSKKLVRLELDEEISDEDVKKQLVIMLQSTIKKLTGFDNEKRYLNNRSTLLDMIQREQNGEFRIKNESGNILCDKVIQSLRDAVEQANKEIADAKQRNLENIRPNVAVLNFTDYFKQTLKAKFEQQLADVQNRLDENAFNQCENGDYQYLSDDILYISNRTMADLKSNFNVTTPLNKDTLYQLQSLFDEDKPVCTVYNVNQAHWIVLCLIYKDDVNAIIVLCKDSFGDASSFKNDIESDLKSAFPNHKVHFKFNSHKEQEDNTSCGIFALENMRIIAHELKKNANFIHDFEEFNSFCSQSQANTLRSGEYADEFVLGVFQSIYNEYLTFEKKMKTLEHHHVELNELNQHLYANAFFHNYKFVDHKIDAADIENTAHTIIIDIRFADNELTDDYMYLYCIELKRIQPDEQQNAVKNKIIDQLQLKSGDFSFEDNTLKILQDKLSSKISQQKKLNVNFICQEEDDDKLIIAFQSIIFKLLLNDSKQADKVFSLIENAKILTTNEHKKIFKNALNTNKAGVEAFQVNVNIDHVKEIARRMLRKKIDKLEICEITNLSLDEVKELDDEQI